MLTPFAQGSLPVGTPASGFASAFAAAINGLAIPGLGAMVFGPQQSCFTISYANGDFEFWVTAPDGTPCEVTNNPLGCSFNPQIEEIANPVPDMVLCGDANNDGAVNIADATVILGCLSPSIPGSPCVICEASADVNGDGAINLADAVCLLGVLFGGTCELAEPLDLTSCLLGK